MGNPSSKVDNSQNNVLAQAQVNLSGIQNMQSQLTYFTIAMLIVICILILIILRCIVKKFRERMDKWFASRMRRLLSSEKHEDKVPNIVIS